METNIGKITAKLSLEEKSKIEFLLEQLNNNIKPSIPLTAEDIHIRCMYLVSDQLNSYGGKFPLEELQRIKDLIIDSPVLVGHKKDELPIARNFYAEHVIKDNVNWIKCFFYWMKSANNANDLKQNIDGGIIKECSIGFTFAKPVCSICHADIRTCRHEPFGQYTQHGSRQECFFYYTQVEKVLEASLVYRGAISNTTISNELSTTTEKSQIPAQLKLEELKSDEVLLITPFYFGIDVHVNSSPSQITLLTDDNQTIPNSITNRFFKEYPRNLQNHIGQLVGYRGKERCSLEELQKFIQGESSIVKRVELKLFPTEKIVKSIYKNIDIMRYRICKKEMVDSVSQKLKTKDGIRIWSLKNFQSISKDSHSLQLSADDRIPMSYNLRYDNQKNAILSIYSQQDKTEFLIQRFSKQDFDNGRKFLASKIKLNADIQNSFTKYNSGRINSIECSDQATYLKLEGVLQGEIFIQPIRLLNEDKYQMYLKV